jgi:hypothetical protein
MRPSPKLAAAVARIERRRDVERVARVELGT